MYLPNAKLISTATLPIPFAIDALPFPFAAVLLLPLAAAQQYGCRCCRLQPAAAREPLRFSKIK
ncbi:hypothetical protein LJC08_05390 [Methanimicrococcus sp. OttesenSCG-928-J09]|nr:hypothetical protein [Methanimicrococcus sp. OttesenSCG-928-J09]